MLPRPSCLAMSLPSLILVRKGGGRSFSFHTFIKLFLQWHSTPLHCHGVLTKGTSQWAPRTRLATAAGWDVSETAPTWSLATRTCLAEPPAHVGAQEQVSRWWDQPRGTCLLSLGKTILSLCAVAERNMGQQGLAQRQGARGESRSPKVLTGREKQHV